MRATGIVRRVDDLGRVVIPKEIRRNMRIKEGDPLEIYTDNEGCVIFKKYSALKDLSDIAQKFINTISDTITAPMLICDKDCCIATIGHTKKIVIDRPITSEIEDMIEERKIYRHGENMPEFSPLYDYQCFTLAVFPINVNGDCIGAVVLTSENTAEINHLDFSLGKITAKYLGSQLED